MDFRELGLSEQTIKAIKDQGIEEPTTVQIDVIPSILAGSDIFTIAPQGCGKTMSYVLPLIEIIAQKKKQTILILTADSKTSAFVSDKITVFNRYHEENSNDEDDANVIIASPDLLLELNDDENIKLKETSILVVDDINLMKRKKQLNNLEKVLALLPAEKQNIVYTNRRSQETQSILEKILKSPQEIKVDKTKEQEANIVAKDICSAEKKNSGKCRANCRTKDSEQHVDKEALDLIRKYNSFCGKTPKFLTIKGIIANED